MRTIVTKNATAAVAALVGLALLPAPTAHGEATVVRDGADAASPTDVLKVKVRHGDKRVRVRMWFDDLAAGMDNATSSAGIYFDTRAKQPGPTYMSGIPLFEGGDWNVAATDGWRPTGEPISCRSDLTLDPERDRADFWVSRTCLDRPARVRVSVRMTDTGGSDWVTDWALRRHRFTTWLTPA